MDKSVGALTPTLAWVPFAVYANNEVAQLLDGIWWQHTCTQRGDSGASRVGLSTAQHGVKASAPLVQAIVMACVGLSYYEALLTNNYNPNNLSAPVHWGRWPVGLRWCMLLSVLGVNGLMVVRLLLNIRCCRCCKCLKSPMAVNGGNVPLLAGSE